MIKLYRLKTSRHKGGVSTGDWSYYEERSEFEEALLLAGLGKLAAGHRADRLSWLSAKRWLELIGRDEDKQGWKTDEVFEAAQLVNGEWVVLEWRVSPPTLSYDVKKVTA